MTNPQAPRQAGTQPRYGRTPMFSGDLAYLSNFFARRFYMPALGVEVATAEHAFNALKTLIPVERQRILSAPTPSKAKMYGGPKYATLRPGWDQGLRVRAMQSVLLAKFADPELEGWLASTGSLHLIETNAHHDSFWGDCFCPRHEGVEGKNMLGELLMALRATSLLRAG